MLRSLLTIHIAAITQHLAFRTSPAKVQTRAASWEGAETLSGYFAQQRLSCTISHAGEGSPGPQNDLPTENEKQGSWKLHGRKLPPIVSPPAVIRGQRDGSDRKLRPLISDAEAPLVGCTILNRQAVEHFGSPGRGGRGQADRRHAEVEIGIAPREP
jgi:hypothetical protein